MSSVRIYIQIDINIITYRFAIQIDIIIITCGINIIIVGLFVISNQYRSSWLLY